MKKNPLESYAKSILKARIYDLARETTLDIMPHLSSTLGNSIWLKREDTQPVFSFKVRGAYNKIRLLNDEQKARGVITASAGNHAQGVAISAQKLGISATIVMPRTTPETKVNAVNYYGAKSILIGDSFDDAFSHCLKLVEENSLVYIPPYDDPDIIAGQGTIAMEIIKQAQTLPDAIFIPVGGGGLAAGITAYTKYLHPSIKIITVEPEDSNCFYAAMQAGRRVKLKQVGLFADGVSVRQIGKEPFSILKHYVDEAICVSADEICAAAKDTFDDHRAMCEPAGSLALAGLKKHVQQNGIQGKQLIAINSGANTSFERIAHIAERSEIGEQREAILAVTLKEKPGNFRKFCRQLNQRSITEFNYRYADTKEAHIFVGLRLVKNETADNLISSLEDKGYKVINMSNNSMAKTHVRHMVGGHKQPSIENEKILRCVFPERPRALLKFLEVLSKNWNISLFHYRNHGAAYGRALIGIQVSESEMAQLKDKLDNLGYEYTLEQDNPAYTCFLN